MKGKKHRGIRMGVCSFRGQISPGNAASGKEGIFPHNLDMKTKSGLSKILSRWLS
jgi:hypothetical protein